MAVTRTRVLIVDDSAFVRAVLERMIAAEPDFEVVGTARDGEDALKRIKELEPDVVTLDVEMPRLDGLQVLERIMAECPRPVVMVSSLTQQGARATVQALAAGAVDVVAKPSGPRSPDLHRTRAELLQKLRVAARARPRRPRATERAPAEGAPNFGGHKPSAGRATAAPGLLLIGASTGGPGALQEFLRELPGDLEDAVLVIQHMPPGFTASLARHLDDLCALPVREACDGDALVPGVVLIAPGGRHLLVGRRRVRLDDGPPRHGVRPAVDVTLESAATVHRGPVTVVILTGMGVDGAQGAFKLHRQGAIVLAQDEASSVVYGMPRAVSALGIVAHSGHPAKLARHYLELRRGGGR